MQALERVGPGVYTLILNVRSCDSQGQPLKQELAEKLAQELDYLQGEARHISKAIKLSKCSHNCSLINVTSRLDA